MWQPGDDAGLSGISLATCSFYHYAQLSLCFTAVLSHFRLFRPAKMWIDLLPGLHILLFRYRACILSRADVILQRLQLLLVADDSGADVVNVPSKIVREGDGSCIVQAAGA